MKNFSILFLFVLLSSFYARSQGGMSIEDYYMIIPSDYFMCDESNFDDTWVARRNLLKITDKKNSYLEAETSSGTLFLAAYKDKDAKKDLVIAYKYCGEGCMCNSFDLRYYDPDGEWEDAGEKMPWNDIEEYIKALEAKQGRDIFPVYTIPQHGKSIMASENGTKNKLFQMEWDGHSFSLIEPEK